MLVGGIATAWVVSRIVDGPAPSWMAQAGRHGDAVQLVAVAIAALGLHLWQRSAIESARHRRLARFVTAFAAAILGARVVTLIALVHRGVVPATCAEAALYYVVSALYVVHCASTLGLFVGAQFAGDRVVRERRLAISTILWYFSLVLVTLLVGIGAWTE